MPLIRQVPIRSMQHVLVSNKKRLVQGLKMRSRTRAARPKTRSVRTLFLPFIFHAYECCMANLIYVRY